MSNYTGQCRAEYEREGGRQPGDRIVCCHLPAGHPGEHEEADTEVTWISPVSGHTDGPFGGCATCGRDFAPGEVFEHVPGGDRWRHVGCPVGYTEADVELVGVAAFHHERRAGGETWDDLSEVDRGSYYDLGRGILAALVAAGRFPTPGTRTEVGWNCGEKGALCIHGNTPYNDTWVRETGPRLYPRGRLMRRTVTDPGPWVPVEGGDGDAG